MSEPSENGKARTPREAEDRRAKRERGARLRRLYLDFTKPVHPLIIKGMVMSALSVICGFVPYLVAVVIAQDALRQEMPSTESLIALSAVAMAFAFLDRVLFGGGTGVCHTADAGFQIHARHMLLDHFSKVPLGWFNDRSSSEVKQAVSDDILGMHQTIGHAPTEVVRAVLYPLVPLVILFVADWRLSLVFLAYIAVFAIVSMAFMMRDYGALSERYGEANMELSSAVVEMVEGIEVVKTFGSAKRAGARYRTAVEELTDVTFAWTKLTAGPFSMLSAFVAPGTVLAFLGLASSLFVAAGQLDFAACVPFLVFGPGIPTGFVTVASGMGFLRTAMQSLEHIDTVLSVEQLPEPAHPEAPPERDLDIAFDEVSFSYGEGAKLALDGVDARLAAGGVYALAGDSGSGKSTFARLIPRFWDPLSGSVSLGQCDLRDVGTQALLSRVAIVFQESMLLSLSIRDNIKLARPSATDDEMFEAAKAARIHDRILEFPQGYDAVIGTSSCDLSGGEAQRIAIARAIIQDAPVLVLDEATAHADPENETAIQDALSHLSRGRTTIVIAHRLNTVSGADRTFVLESGKVIEEGTHGELVKGAGRYAQLWHMQQSHTVLGGRVQEVDR